MTDTQRRYLAEVRRIVQQHVPAGSGRVWLIGSWARDEIRVASDIDLAVEPEQRLPPGRLGELREALEESAAPYSVDVVDLGTVDETFRARVRAEGIAWPG